MGCSEKNPISACLGSMPLLRRIVLICSASCDARLYAARGDESCAEILNVTSAVSGADSNLPSALTYTVFACAVIVGGFCAAAPTANAIRSTGTAIADLPYVFIHPRLALLHHAPSQER